ncbi:hypothetical protein BDN72DRAFT_750697, partial [Pluteus cervinus]
LQLNAAGIARNREPPRAVERNAVMSKDDGKNIPKPIVITILIEGHPVNALIDSGSIGDFISSNVVEQLHLRRKELNLPIALNLAVQGSKTKVNYEVKANLQYQGIREEREFLVINCRTYDVILGTPFLWQHQVSFSLNPATIIIGNNNALSVPKGKHFLTLESASMAVEQDRVEKVRQELIEYASPLFKKAGETGLPPFRAINHEIPLIDETIRYPWRASRCPEPLLPQWIEKRETYLKTGRWRVTTSTNTVPMMFIRKPG